MLIFPYRYTVYLLPVALLVLPNLHSRGWSKPREHRLKIPGSGVSIAVPSSWHLTKLGAYVVNESEDINIVIQVFKLPLASADADRILDLSFTHERETVKLGRYEAVLAARNRADDGGGYDGYCLRAKGERHALSIIASDTGANPQRWRQFRTILLSILWNEDESDPVLGFGAKPGHIEHLAMEGGGSSLAYKGIEPAAEQPSWEADPAKPPTLMFTALPKQADYASIGKTCIEKLSAIVAKSNPTTVVGAPLAISGPSVRGCEVSGPDKHDGTVGYWAFAATKNGGAFMAYGAVYSRDAAPWFDRFRRVTTSLVPLR